jgi:hypothetical protein
LLGSDIKLKIGEYSFSIKGAKVKLAEASLIIEGSTFVPLGLFDSVK